MEEQSDAYIEIFLTKKGQNYLSKREMIAVMQLLRITNALRFQIGLLLHTMNEKNKLFQLRSQIEIYSIIASSFKEATKEFYNNLFKILEPLSGEEELKNYDIRIMSLDFLKSFQTEIEAWKISPIEDFVRCAKIVFRNRINFDIAPQGSLDKYQFTNEQ